MSLPFSRIKLDIGTPTAGEWVIGKVVHDFAQREDFSYEISTDNDAISNVNPRRVIVQAGELQSRSFFLKTFRRIDSKVIGYVYASGRSQRGIPRESRRAAVHVMPPDLTHNNIRPTTRPIGVVNFTAESVVGGTPLTGNRLKRSASEDPGYPAREMTVDHNIVAITTIVNEENAEKANVVSWALHQEFSQPFRINTATSNTPTSGEVWGFDPESGKQTHFTMLDILSP